ncbi:MAG TPA: cytochrome P450, partial [Kineosporiaceae bacterium]
VAGFETTVNFFGNMMLSLLEAPEIFTAMPHDRVALEAAVEELLRLHTPAHIVRRHAAEDIEVAGHSIPAGSDIAILLALCNRDPRVFSEADRFQFGRSPNPHLSFAFGRHYCVGATLARLELVAMLRAICSRLPALQLSPRSRAGWSGRLLGRGLSEVRVLR